MESQTIDIPGVIVVQPKVFGDERGYFFESFQEKRYAAAGITAKFIQDNYSSSTKGILRGLHYQLKHPQGKLVTVIAGKVLDVMVDIRVGSPTFGKYYSIILDGKLHNQVYVPPGLAHGFYTLTDEVIFAYKCTDVYHPEDEYGVAWNDPDLGIAWGNEVEPTLSAKDQKHPFLKDIPTANLPKYEL